MARLTRRMRAKRRANFARKSRQLAIYNVSQTRTDNRSIIRDLSLGNTVYILVGQSIAYELAPIADTQLNRRIISNHNQALGWRGRENLPVTLKYRGHQITFFILHHNRRTLYGQFLGLLEELSIAAILNARNFANV